MKRLISAAAVVALLATSAAAEKRYDRKLEQAARDVAASKMGELRGGFSYDEKPQFVVVHDKMATGSVSLDRTVGVEASATLPEGLSRAVERKASRIVAF